jgi:RNA polymerase sigma-70 factor (ECF subfamily)
VNEAEFGAFYAETSGPLSTYVTRLTGDAVLAGDITQDCYYRFLRTAPSSLDYEGRRRYLFRIATNRVRDHFGRAGQQVEEIPATMIGSEGEEVVRRQVLADDLSASLQQLPLRSRELLWLAYVEGLTHREIAQSTGVAEGSVRPLLYRARKALAAILRQRGYGPADPQTGEK